MMVFSRIGICEIRSLSDLLLIAHNNKASRFKMFMDWNSMSKILVKLLYSMAVVTGCLNSVSGLPVYELICLSREYKSTSTWIFYPTGTKIASRSLLWHISLHSHPPTLATQFTKWRSLHEWVINYTMKIMKKLAPGTFRTENIFTRFFLNMEYICWGLGRTDITHSLSGYTVIDASSKFCGRWEKCSNMAKPHIAAIPMR